MSEERKELGDLLGDPEWLAAAQSSAGFPNPPEPREYTFAEVEDLIGTLAELSGADAKKAKDLLGSKSNPLARAVRALFGVSGDKADPFWIAIGVLARVRAEGIVGDSVFTEAERHLKGRNITPDSLRTYEKIAAAILRSHPYYRFSELARLFGGPPPAGGRPPRTGGSY